jgi:hypothetical protein
MPNSECQQGPVELLPTLKLKIQEERVVISDDHYLLTCLCWNKPNVKECATPGHVHAHLQFKKFKKQSPDLLI